MGDPVAHVTIDRAEIAACLDEMAQFGRHPTGGMQRLVYTTAWQDAVDQYVGWLDEAGLQVRRDAVGNVFGVATGRDPGPSIVTGSHIDTALRGGHFDGTLGVVAGYVAVRTLLRTFGPPTRTLETLAICDEEASRFHSNLWGSRAIAGLIEPGEVDAIVDAEGASVADAMRSCNLNPMRVADAHRDDIDVFLELHIEQGPVLEDRHLPVGIVEAITALEEFECAVEGRADHAGGFPMDARRDPIIPTAEMVLEITRLARELGPPAVATIGRISAEPGAPNIVAALVRFTVDVRYPDAVAHRHLVERIQDACQVIAARHGVGLRTERLAFQPPTQSSPELIALMCRTADDLGLPYLKMVSGAGHDTQVLARAGVRRAMIFVPSRDGRSHSPDEFTSLDDIVLGVRLLTETLYRLAYQ